MNIETRPPRQQGDVNPYCLATCLAAANVESLGARNWTASRLPRVLSLERVLQIGFPDVFDVIRVFKVVVDEDLGMPGKPRDVIELVALGDLARLVRRATREWLGAHR